MAEILTVTTLRSKRDEIAHSIQLYEHRLEQARADLAHVAAVIRIFEAGGDPKDMALYVDTHRLFKYGELPALCKVALADSPMTTRDIALHVVKAKGLNADDKVLVRGVAYRLIHSLRSQARAGKIELAGKRHGASVWKLPPQKTIV
jgi:hypothetical protein